MGNVYVPGLGSSNAFKIATPGTCSTSGTPCTITEIIDSTGDGTNILNGPWDIAVDVLGDVCVPGSGSSNAFAIADSHPVIPVPSLTPLGRGLAVLLLLLAATAASGLRPRRGWL